MIKKATKLRCGIIGCGVIAPVHAETYASLENVEVSWACDLIKNKAQALAEKFDIASITTDYKEVLADKTVDCISVCTDHGSHAKIVTAALDSGKHVLCEKALAPSTEDLDSMVEAHARNDNLVFAGVFQNRYTESFRALKQLVDEGAFGTILTATVRHVFFRSHHYYEKDAWRGTWDRDGGAAMINQAIHFVDAIHWIMGGISSLCASCTNLTHQDVIDTEDTVAVALQFANGALGTLTATSSSSLNWDSMIAIYGTHGTVEIRNGKASFIEFKDETAQEHAKALFAAKKKHSGTRAAKSYYGPYHDLQIADFIGAVREGREPFVSGEEARKAVDVVLAIYESSRNKRWVTIEDYEKKRSSLSIATAV